MTYTNASFPVFMTYNGVYRQQVRSAHSRPVISIHSVVALSPRLASLSLDFSFKIIQLSSRTDWYTSALSHSVFIHSLNCLNGKIQCTCYFLHFCMRIWAAILVDQRTWFHRLLHKYNDNYNFLYKEVQYAFKKSTFIRYKIN